ncbi:MAG: hypothetical protein OEY38_20385, partial [Gammaproteobacteria bacterium]|nr:hypothetical protein [Gammaproteobacteria bacterium]
GKVAKYIEEGYRTFRKHTGAAVTISQSLGDTLSQAKPIVKTSNFIVLLQTPGSDLSELKEKNALNLTSWHYDMLETVNTDKGAYSEVFILNQHTGQADVARYIVPRYTYYLFTSDGKEKEAINQLQREGYSLPEAIEQMVVRFG